MPLVGHIHGVLLLVDHEVEVIRNLWHVSLIVLNIEILGFLHELLHARLAQELDKRLIFRESLVATEQEFGSLVLIAVGNSLLRLVQCLGDESALIAVKFLDIRSENLELLVIL